MQIQVKGFIVIDSIERSEKCDDGDVNMLWKGTRRDEILRYE